MIDLPKNSSAYHCESQLSNFIPLLEYFNWERRKDEVAARRLLLPCVFYTSFGSAQKFPGEIEK